VSQRRTYRSRIAVADTDGSRLPDVVIVLVEIPESPCPAAHPVAARNQGPVSVLDLRPKLGRNARRADWAVVPTRSRFLAVALHGLLLRLPQFGAARLENSLSITRDEPLDLLDEQRKRRLGICSDAQIGFLVASEMPVVTPRKKIKGADTYQFRVRFQGRS